MVVVSKIPYNVALPRKFFNSMKKPNYIIALTLVLSSCAKAPDACFTVSPVNVKVGDVVTFNADCSKNASSYKWNFGDNTKDTTLNNNNLVTHVYKTSGNFVVKLSAGRKDGVTFKKGTPEKSLTIVVQ